MYVNGQISAADISVDTAIFPSEKTHISVNSNLLLAGELLLLKGYSLNSENKESKLSDILYVSLRNAEDSIVFRQKLKLANGTANSDFFLPATLMTGTYKLIAYTNYTLNNAENPIFEKNIYVLNPFVKSELVNKIETDSVNSIRLDFSENLIVNNSNKVKLSIKTDKETYSFRQKVSLNITNDSAKELGGNFVISVRKKDAVEITNPNIGKVNFENNKYHIPEVRGEIISGNIENLNPNVSVANKVVSLTIPGKNYILKLAKTDAKGQFFFSVDENYLSSESIVQIVEPNRLDYKLIMNDNLLKLNNLNGNQALLLNINLKKWLEERSVQLQLENAYYNTKKDSLLPRDFSKPFYDNLGVEYLLDDFTRFPTVKETFLEVITLAGTRKEGERTKFVVFNEYDPNRNAQFNNIDPLVLMDGMLIQDAQDILEYNARDIHSIRVLVEPYRYGPKLYSGIIAINTKKGDFHLPINKDYIKKLRLESPVNQKEYYFPDYAENHKLKRIPDNRVQLLWQPNFKLRGEINVQSFFTSDVSGKYEIKIEGYSENGEYIMSTAYFEVE